MWRREDQIAIRPGVVFHHKVQIGRRYKLTGPLTLYKDFFPLGHHHRWTDVQRLNWSLLHKVNVIILCCNVWINYFFITVFHFLFSPALESVFFVRQTTPVSGVPSKTLIVVLVVRKGGFLVSSHREDESGIHHVGPGRARC